MAAEGLIDVDLKDLLLRVGEEATGRGEVFLLLLEICVQLHHVRVCVWVYRPAVHIEGTTIKINKILNFKKKY